MTGDTPIRSAPDLGGVLIPAATPFDPVTGEVDVVGLRGNLRDGLSHPVRGIVIGGSTGEAVLLDEAERAACLEAARGVVPADRLLVAGTGAESTRATIRLSASAAREGADAVLVQPPAYYRGQMTPAALRDHYRAVADAAPIPVIVYQVPLRFSTLDLPSGLVAELAEHPNIVGIKDSRGDLDRLGELLDHVPRAFQVLVGNGAKLYASLELGAVGGILGVANLAPAESAGIVAAQAAGDGPRAGRLQERVGPLHNGVVSAYGVPGVKHAMDLLGLKGGSPRPPLRPLAAKDAGKVESLMAAWAETAEGSPAAP